MEGGAGEEGAVCACEPLWVSRQAMGSGGGKGWGRDTFKGRVDAVWRMRRCGQRSSGKVPELLEQAVPPPECT